MEVADYVKDDGISGVAILAHEIYEGFQHQGKGISNYETAHDIALRLQGMIDGYTNVKNIAQDKILVTKNYTGDILISPSTNPAYNLQAGYTAILGNKNVGSLIVQQSNAINVVSNTVPTFAGDINTTSAQVVVGNSFRFIPNSSLGKTTTTNLTIVGNESGGSISIEVTVTVPTQ